ncbi:MULTISPECIES: helix-turn-helix transcriptional regulator [Burkholderia cepacia complex]|uniref:helix-turn-helix transcriptional regulator n=1 Tax=Burkholderia cepacia complex TaxID=87882 RepID=UPI00048400F6|nr:MULTISPECIES: DNA-binding protein [Burkholderia cepacia complex]MDN7779387.1 DNA-binding protein [Burkholderia orbicola]
MTNDDSRKLDGRRISAKEAAEFLGVSYQNISRIDRQGEYIKRYRLGHKTYVYDLDSLHAFLEAKLVKPHARIDRHLQAAKARRVTINSPEVTRSPLQEFLREQIRKADPKKKGK